MLALADANRMVLAAAGAAVVFASAYESINQYHSNWIAYRSTAEELKHEKYLHLAKAGPYASAENADKLLAERLEGLVSQEHAKWVSNAQEHGRGSNR